MESAILAAANHATVTACLALNRPRTVVGRAGPWKSFPCGGACQGRRRWEPTLGRADLDRLSFYHRFLQQLTDALAMKNSLFQARRLRRGFTLIELLVVFRSLHPAGLLLPVISKARTTAKVAQAKVEINSIANAISKYEADNSRFPASQKLRTYCP